MALVISSTNLQPDVPVCVADAGAVTSGFPVGWIPRKQADLTADLLEILYWSACLGFK